MAVECKIAFKDKSVSIEYSDEYLHQITLSEYLSTLISLNINSNAVEFELLYDWEAY